MTQCYENTNAENILQRDEKGANALGGGRSFRGRWSCQVQVSPHALKTSDPKNTLGDKRALRTGLLDRAKESLCVSAVTYWSIRSDGVAPATMTIVERVSFAAKNVAVGDTDIF